MIVDQFELDAMDPWVHMPENSVPVACGVEDGAIVVWAEVDPAAKLIERRIVTVDTRGARVPDTKFSRHLGTVTVDERPAGGQRTVIHVYDTGDERPIWE